MSLFRIELKLNLITLMNILYIIFILYYIIYYYIINGGIVDHFMTIIKT